jgi:hypothetical protein
MAHGILSTLPSDDARRLIIDLAEIDWERVARVSVFREELTGRINLFRACREVFELYFRQRYETLHADGLRRP